MELNRNTEVESLQVSPPDAKPMLPAVASSVKHPATYTESFIPKFAELLFGCANVLDPFGGVVS